MTDITFPTKRPTVDAMEVTLGKPFHVLDHGFIRVVDYMGDDAAVVQAARVSYGEGTKTFREDQGLINYLMRHWHTTPFEMCELKLHVKLPIFVARQWIRHRTASVNEYSARYSILDKEFYFPSEEEMRRQSTRNKQGSEGTIDPSMAKAWLVQAVEEADRDYGLYEVGTKGDVARELSRMVLPLNIYTQWYWKVNAHNLMHFLRLRTDKHAQAEIREYANKIEFLLSNWLPMTYRAFVNHRLNACTFSGPQMFALRQFIQTRKMLRPPEMSGEEWDQLCELIEGALSS